jgi:hypothetical protein
MISFISAWQTRNKVTCALPKTFTLVYLSSTPQVSKLDKPEAIDNYIYL